MSDTPLWDEMIAAEPPQPEAPKSATPLYDAVLKDHQTSAPVPVLGLKPAPKVKWDGVTKSILNQENEMKRIQNTKQELGMSPDIFPEDPTAHFGGTIMKWVQDNKEEINAIDTPHWSDSIPMVKPIKQGLKTASLLEKQFVDPILKEGFETFMSGAAGTDSKARPQPAKGAAVSLLRAGGQMFAGKEQFESRVHDPEMVRGINQLEGALGSTGATAALTAADIAGQAPLFIIGTGKTMLEASASGAVTALAAPDISMEEGGAFAGALHGGGQVLSKVYAGVKRLLAKDLPALAQPTESIFKGYKPKSDAEVLAKNPKMSAEFENRLIGVVTKDGLQQIDDDLARALPSAEPKGKLPPGTKPVRSTATLDPNGNPVIVTSYFDPHGVSPQRFEIVPLTSESARKAFKAAHPHGTGMSTEFQRLWAMGEYAKEADALLGLERWHNDMGDTLISGYRKLTPEMLDSPAIASAGDYVGTYQKPAGAEIRLVNGQPKITPVFDDVRLPDEIPPVGEPTKAGSPGRKAGRSEPTQEVDRAALTKTIFSPQKVVHLNRYQDLAAKAKKDLDELTANYEEMRSATSELESLTPTQPRFSVAGDGDSTAGRADELSAVAEQVAQARTKYWDLMDKAQGEASREGRELTQARGAVDIAKIGVPMGGGSGKPPPEGIRPVGTFDDEAAPETAKSIFAKSKRNLEGPRVNEPDDLSAQETETPVRPEAAPLEVRADEFPTAPERKKSIFKPVDKSKGDNVDDADHMRIRGPDVPEVSATPQGPPSPANVTPETIASLDRVVKGYASLQADKSGVDKALSLIAGRHLRGPVDLATTVTSIQASNQMAKMSDDIRGALEVFFPKGLLDQSNLDLHRYMEGNLTDEAFFAKHPQLTQKAQTFSRGLFEEKEYWDKWFQARGVVPEQLGDARAQGIVPLYVARRFWAHLLPPKAWAKKSMAPGRADVMLKGIERIHKDMLAASPKIPHQKQIGNLRTTQQLPTISSDEIAVEVARIMNAEDPIAAFKTSNIGKPYQSLMEKNRALPSEVLDMMGEVKSGTVSTALTLGMQRANATRYTLMEEIASNPEFTSRVPDIERGLTYPLPDQGSMFTAKGLYTNQAIFEALGNGPKITESSHKLLHWMQRMVKGHQVVGGLIGPHLNSLMDNLKGGVLSGGLDLTRPLKSGASMYSAAHALLDYKKDPTGRTGRAGLVLDAKRNGADYFGFGHEEINNPASLKFHKDLNEAFPDPRGNFLDRTGNLLLRSMKGYERGLAWLGGGLDWVDRLFRMQSYIALQDKYLADFAKNGANSYLVKAGLIDTRPGMQGAASEVRTMKFNAATRAELNSPQRMVHEAAGRLAARRVNQSFWNPTFVGTGVEKLRKSAVGIVTPYATAMFEGWRVNGQVLHRLASGEEPDLKWRLLVSTMALGGAVGGMKAMSGVTDEETDQANAETAEGKSTYRPATFTIPWHDDKGRVQFWNYTSWTELTRLMQGDPSDPMLNRVLSNLVMSPLQGGLAEQPARRAMEMAGVVSSIGKPDAKVGVAESGGMAFLKYLHSAGAFPSVFTQMANAARRTDIGSEGMPQFLGPTIGEYVPPLGDLIGQPSPYEEVLTPAEGAMKAVGISNLEPVSTGPMDPYGRSNPSRKLANVEANAEMGKSGSLVKEIKKIFRTKKSRESKVEDAQEVKDKLRESQQERREKVDKRKK